MKSVNPEPADELQHLAYSKIANVLGPDRGRRLLEQLLDEMDLELQTPDDLLRLSERMTRMGGFEGAVGAMLGVAAVIRGATPSR